MSKFKFDQLDQDGIVPMLTALSGEPLPEKLMIFYPVIPTAEELIKLANKADLYIFRRGND
jgi:hypothetical protein